MCEFALSFGVRGLQVRVNAQGAGGFDERLDSLPQTIVDFE